MEQKNVVRLKKCALIFLLSFPCWPIKNGLGNPDAKRLFEDLLHGYNKLSRPINSYNKSVQVKFRLKLAQILDVEWIDMKLSWSPMDYGNVTVLYVPSELLWLPDIVLYNNADGSYHTSIMTKAMVDFTGKVRWEPPAIFKSMCPIDVEWFPFDRQTCLLKFGSWTYDRQEVNLVHGHNASQIEQITEQDDFDRERLIELVPHAIDLSTYYPSVEWDIMAVPGKRHEGHYPCCPQLAGYVDITYYIELRRKTGFYIINFIAPCLAISLLTLLTFYLPSQSGEKISLIISILLSETVFLLLLVDIIPSTSLVLPLIGRYLLFTMIMVTLSIMVTVVIIHAHFTPTSQSMPNWIKRVFLELIPPIIGMRFPGQMIKRQAELTKEKLIQQQSQQQQPALSRNPCCSTSIPNDMPTTSFQTTKKKTEEDKQCSSSSGGDGQAKSNQPATFPSAASCNKPAPERSSSRYQDLRNMPSLRQLLYIKDHFVRRNVDSEKKEDWYNVAMVLDRIFFIVFGIVSLGGTFAILLQAPSLYDSQVPLV